jgi:serine/threonine-protein kinase
VWRAVLPEGGFLFTDNGNVVRQVSAQGVITRVAGTGAAGASGDGAPAHPGPAQAPAGVAVTGDGRFLFADLGNNVVHKVAPVNHRPATPPGSAPAANGAALPSTRQQRPL